MLCAVFLAAFDFNVVTVAIPSIQRGLATTFSEIQLIVAGYALSFAVLLITGGRLGDLYGRRRLYVVGMTGFTIASALCGFARVPAELVGARVLQGSFAAIMVPQALSFIQVTFTPKEQSVAYAIYGMIIGLGMLAGQVLGGLLVSADVFGLAWRPVFLVNLPVGVAAIALTWWLVPESRAAAGLRLDPGGVVLVSVSLLLLLYPLIRGEEAGWPTWTRISLAGSVLVMHLFLQYERWKTKRDGSPVLVLSLFRHRSFVVGLAIGVAFFSGLASFFLLLTEYLQTGLGRSPRAAGLTFIPFAIGFLSASLASARLAPRLGRSILQLGAALMITGLVALLAVVGRRADPVAYILPLFIYGVGQGNLQAPLVNFILADVPPRDAGSASGVVTTVQQLAFALGVAVIGGVFAVSLGPDPAAARYGEAFVHALAWNIGLLAVTFVAAFAFPRRQRVLRIADAGHPSAAARRPPCHTGPRA
jgi:EmrB/QacA subfamily drug resistance transporter